MSGVGAEAAALHAHLGGGITTVCRCWSVARRDGVVLGFTDHDEGIAFDGVEFRANSGLTAKALVQSTGLAVDNTEALGALMSEAITEDDILAGRYDGAEVRAWMVNWAAPGARLMLFCGSIGEVSRSGGAFEAELRGLTETLNQPQGRVYQPQCSAVLGDGMCRFDLSSTGYSTEVAVEKVEGGRVFTFAGMAEFDQRWFERGRLSVLTGAARGLVGLVKNDRLTNANRVVELWEQLPAQIDEGDVIRLEAGCDKRGETCRLKFDNFLNFRGFPHIPGEDWLMSYPKATTDNSGGQRKGEFLLRLVAGGFED
ncbi:DUF2163 domain-containing protein [Vannielia litorea]|uniref:Bacteriophage phiJL001 Gp84 C-terminal domain-containing protein n=1 Tax=Vannielia litorea TaxID=1217970 RepID=A0A1N6F1U0_9RHOB|nr:DUF2163 domain-containing protein [Vannielia litorea]SIN89250.1 phage conserved hypothetical protein BR0599 [Vannielia litorea]